MSGNIAFSEGARYERKAIRARLRRRIRYYAAENVSSCVKALELELEWNLSRQQRYDKKPGGLGRTR